MAAQGAFGTDFNDRSILHRAYYRSGHKNRSQRRPGQPCDPPNSLCSKPRTEYKRSGFPYNLTLVDLIAGHSHTIWCCWCILSSVKTIIGTVLVDYISAFQSTTILIHVRTLFPLSNSFILLWCGFTSIRMYTLSEAWSGVNFYDRSTKTIVGTMLWTEYRPVIKIGPKGALGSQEIRPIHSAPSLGQSIPKHNQLTGRAD